MAPQAPQRQSAEHVRVQVCLPLPQAPQGRGSVATLVGSHSALGELQPLVAPDAPAVAMPAAPELGAPAVPALGAPAVPAFGWPPLPPRPALASPASPPSPPGEGLGFGGAPPRDVEPPPFGAPAASAPASPP
jgi:hypothetical protein